MAEELQIPLRDVIGDNVFAEALQRRSAEGDTPAITVDASGAIIGDTSSIDPHMLAQLQTPESKRQIADMYRRARYRPEPPRPPRMITDIYTVDPRGNPRAAHQRRDLSGQQIAPGRLGRRMLRQYLRKRTKIERASAGRESSNGRQSDQSSTGDSTAGL